MFSSAICKLHILPGEKAPAQHPAWPRESRDTVFCWHVSFSKGDWLVPSRTVCIHSLLEGKARWAHELLQNCCLYFLQVARAFSELPPSSWDMSLITSCSPLSPCTSEWWSSAPQKHDVSYSQSPEDQRGLLEADASGSAAYSSQTSSEAYLIWKGGIGKLV